MTPTPDVAALTQFDYLLNAFEHASQSAEPAEHGYGAKRRALFAYVRQLERDSSALRAAEQRAEAEEKRAVLLQGALERADRLAAAEANRARVAEGLLREARDYVAAAVEQNRANWGDRLMHKQQFDIDVLAKIDAALKQGEQP